MSLSIALLGYFLLAIVAILDKSIVSREKVTPAQFAFYSTAPALLLFIALPFGVAPLGSPFEWLMAVVAGGAFAAALWIMYQGFEHSEVSHLGPFIGGVVPLVVLILGQLFLNEPIAPRQLLAVALLAVGSLIISFEQSREHSGWHRGMVWGLASGLLFAVSHVTSKYLYDARGFWSGLVWSRGAMALIGFLFIAAPSVRQKLTATFSPQGRNNSLFRRLFTKKFGFVAFDKTLAIIGVVMVQYAIARGSVTIVNALNGLQYAFVVIMVYLLTTFSPRLFREIYRHGELAQEIAAIGLLIAGLALLII